MLGLKISVTNPSAAADAAPSAVNARRYLRVPRSSFPQFRQGNDRVASSGESRSASQKMQIGISEIVLAGRSVMGGEERFFDYASRAEIAKAISGGRGRGAPLRMTIQACGPDGEAGRGWG